MCLFVGFALLVSYVALVFGMGEWWGWGDASLGWLERTPKFLRGRWVGDAMIYILKNIKNLEFTINICSCL
jgi:hypothetical protein